jgi:acetyl coenzyme A synthetase (ADP forming)-like protein
MHASEIHDYAEPAVLRDGGSLLIRAVRASDKLMLLDLFRRLSPESIRHRAFGAKKELSERELAYLTELDFVKHVGLAAVLREDGEEHLVGVARYYRIPARGTAAAPAEAAFTVVDEHQGRGIGTVLLEHLARIARAEGIDELEADVMADNARMMDVFADSGFTVRRSMDAGVYHVAFPTSATESFVRASVARERHAAAESVRVFFEPASVAVIGASRREGSIGRAILANLKRCGFARPIYPINLEAGELEGLPCFPNVGAVKAKIDLAIIAVPASAVEKVTLECARAGVRGVVVISSGFAEASPEGRKGQNALSRLVRTSGMRMIGPNCMGVLSTAPTILLNATFAPTWPPAGNVSMLSQSGALGIAMLDHAAHLNIGIAKFVSVGNKADVSGNDLLSYWADDPATDVIALYLESFGNPRKFGRIAPEVARKKPIVAVKSGRSAAGTRAAASHSASLASLDVGVDALFAQAGVIRTATLEELFDVVALLSTQPLPEGPRIGVVTNAGGPGILLADACEAHGLSLPELTPGTLERLRTFLPPQAGFGNPIDMIASATPEQYERAIKEVATDPNIDALVVIYIPPLVTRPEDVAAAIARGAASVPSHKPIATVFMSSKGTPAVLSTGPRGKIPSYSFPENAAIALAAAMRYARWRKRPAGSVITLAHEQESAIRKIVERTSAGATSPFWVPAEDVARILKLAGVPLAELRVTAPDADEAARVATSMGYPIVAKAVARGLVHKTDIGGVILGLDSEEAVRSAVRTLAERTRTAGHELEGVVLQRQIDGGVEAIVGVTTDPSMGPLLVAGFGGVQVELLRDVAFRLTPVSDVDAAEMLDGLRAAKLLDGFRGAPAADRAALLTLIQRVSALVEVLPNLLELELNPVKVLTQGEGAMAVDARMRIAPA